MLFINCLNILDKYNMLSNICQAISLTNFKIFSNGTLFIKNSLKLTDLTKNYYFSKSVFFDSY